MTAPGSVRNACQAPPLLPKYEGAQTPMTFPTSLTPVAVQFAVSLTLNGPRFLTEYVVGVGAGAQGLGLGNEAGLNDGLGLCGVGVGVGVGVDDGGAVGTVCGGFAFSTT